jgi:hypothetical protein
MSWDRDLKTSKRWFEYAWCLRIGLVIRDLEQRYASGGESAEGVYSPTFQVENLALIGCVWQ